MLKKAYIAEVLKYKIEPIVRRIKTLVIISFLLLLSEAAFSQAITPNSGDIFEETSDVPIDGAIALLTLTGLGIGVKKLYNRKK